MQLQSNSVINKGLLRRPLLNITNFQQPPVSPPYAQNISRPSSTKNIRPRISIDEFSRPKIKHVHSKSKKQSRNESADDHKNANYKKQTKESNAYKFQYQQLFRANYQSEQSNTQSKTKQKQKEKVCRNHRNRQAMHVTQTQFIQYLCLQCSLIYAKQGHKIKSIASMVQVPQQTLSSHNHSSSSKQLLPTKSKIINNYVNKQHETTIINNNNADSNAIKQENLMIIKNSKSNKNILAEPVKTKTNSNNNQVFSNTNNLSRQISTKQTKCDVNIKISPNLQSQLARKTETSQYLNLHNQIISLTTKWLTQHNILRQNMHSYYADSINKYKQSLQDQIYKITKYYQELIANKQRQRQEQINKIQSVKIEIQKYQAILSNIKSDIMINYEDCIGAQMMTQKLVNPYSSKANNQWTGISNQEFRYVMDQYWKKIREAQFYMLSNSISNFWGKTQNSGQANLANNAISSNTLLIPQNQVQMKMTVRTMGRTVENIDSSIADFTFSKQKKFDTPPFSKQLRGIKLVQSQPDSKRYQSSMRESIVDARLHVNDFQFNI